MNILAVSQRFMFLKCLCSHTVKLPIICHSAPWSSCSLSALHKGSSTVVFFCWDSIYSRIIFEINVELW